MQCGGKTECVHAQQVCAAWGCPTVAVYVFVGWLHLVVHVRVLTESFLYSPVSKGVPSMVSHPRKTGSVTRVQTSLGHMLHVMLPMAEGTRALPTAILEGCEDCHSIECGACSPAGHLCACLLPGLIFAERHAEMKKCESLSMRCMAHLEGCSSNAVCVVRCMRHL